MEVPFKVGFLLTSDGIVVVVEVVRVLETLLMKIENQSHEQSYKLDVIGV